MSTNTMRTGASAIKEQQFISYSLNQTSQFEYLLRTLSSFEPIRSKGHVSKVTGLLVESTGPNASVGDICWIAARNGRKRKAAEVVGLGEVKFSSCRSRIPMALQLAVR